MFQTTVKTVAVKNNFYSLTPTEKWDEAVQYIRSEIAWHSPVARIQAAVDLANKRGMACKTTAYERREALQNALYGTGYHLDRKNRVNALSSLISLADFSLSDEFDTPCVKFKIKAKLGVRDEYASNETLEWLGADGNVVSADRHLDINPEPLVEASRALDAYMTDVKSEVYRRLENVVFELRLSRQVSERYHNMQYAPVWAAGREICAALAREGIVPDFAGDHLGTPDIPDVLVTLQTYRNDDGEIDGTVFVVLVRSLGRAGVVFERNCQYGKAVWVQAANVNEALIEYERSKG